MTIQIEPQPLPWVRAVCFNGPDTITVLEAIVAWMRRYPRMFVRRIDCDCNEGSETSTVFYEEWPHDNR